jgi:GT2 family glycosyltransferase
VKTTILMLSVDEAPLLEYSLPAAVALEGADVVVVDNASSDATAELCARHGARHLPLPERVSYCAAMNAGLAATGDADAVLLLNADCVVAPEFLAAALPHLREADVGSVAPRLVRSTGMGETDRLDVLDTAGMVVDRRRKNGLVGHNEPMERYPDRGAAFGGDGAAVLYRRRTLDECAIDGEVFDEDFELWASDVDLAWRAQVLGWRCVYEPAAVAWHKRFYSPSTRGALSAEHRRLQFRNRYLMMVKNDSARSLLRDLPRIAAYEVLALGYVVLRERDLARGYADAMRLLPRARRRRRVIQARRARGRRVPFGALPPAARPPARRAR